ncbi:MAG: ABC transporter permease [Chloroflexi bacterium]|nr:ABC transporter permease [Chloroflexota bacterium]
MTDTRKEAPDQPLSGAPLLRKHLLLIVGGAAGLIVTLFVMNTLFDGSLEKMTGTTDWRNILLVNALVGACIFLFVVELRRGAIRVLLTVIVALLLGFLVTFVFNLDAADRFARGEFRVQVVSDAEPTANDDVDLRFNRVRGGDFNKPNVVEPLSEVAWTFAGADGDLVSLLAYAKNRRSEVDLLVELRDDAGTVLAAATSATETQVEEKFDDLVSVKDAVIEGYELPADGVYTLYAKPEEIATGTVLSEALSQSQLAFEALLLGPIERVNRWGVWIQDAITLILLGMSFAIVFRAQQFSLGAEGQLYFGALVSGIIALNSPHVPGVILIPFIILASGTAGFVYGLIPGALKAYLGANELVSTLMLNVVATRFFEMVLNFQLKPPDAGYVASAKFTENAVLPVIVDKTQVTVAVFLLVVVVFLSWLLIRRTPLGYEIRIIGSNLRFANYGGVNSRRTIMLVMAIGGIVAGLAGMHLANGIHRQLILNISFALAFEGVVVALLARLNVLVVPFTGLLYAYLRAGAQFMERDANVSFEVVRMIQAIIILLITAEALVTFFQARQKRADIDETGHTVESLEGADG